MLVAIVILVVIIVVCVKKNQLGKIGVSDPSLPGDFRDVDTESNGDDAVKPKNLALLHDRIVTRQRASSPSCECYEHISILSLIGQKCQNFFPNWSNLCQFALICQTLLLLVVTTTVRFSIIRFIQ